MSGGQRLSNGSPRGSEISRLFMRSSAGSYVSVDSTRKPPGNLRTFDLSERD